MALVCGDIHGNINKIKLFLQYKPEEEHVFTGDFMDSYKASDDQIIEALDMYLEDEDAKSVWGNHEFNYMQNLPEMRCSGRRDNPVFIHKLRANKDRFYGALVRDEYIITHGGITKEFGKAFDDIHTMCAYINREINKVVSYDANTALVRGEVLERPLNEVFNIAWTRGGNHQFGGPLWADYKQEHFDNRFNQVFGHTHSDLMKVFKVFDQNTNKRVTHAAVDCAEFWCFNTATGYEEDFMPKVFRDTDAGYKLERQAY